MYLFILGYSRVDCQQTNNRIREDNPGLSGCSSRVLTRFHQGTFTQVLGNGCSFPCFQRGRYYTVNKDTSPDTFRLSLALGLIECPFTPVSVPSTTGHPVSSTVSPVDGTHKVIVQGITSKRVKGRKKGWGEVYLEML